MEKLSRYLWNTSFAPDYSATILVAKLLTNCHEHSIYILFQWITPYSRALQGVLLGKTKAILKCLLSTNTLDYLLEPYGKEKNSFAIVTFGNISKCVYSQQHILTQSNIYWQCLQTRHCQMLHTKILIINQAQVVLTYLY